MHFVYGIDIKYHIQGGWMYGSVLTVSYAGWFWHIYPKQVSAVENAF